LKNGIRKTDLIWSAAFASLGVVGWWGTVSNRGNRDEQLVFALLWVLSVIGATGCLAIPLIHQISERSSRVEAADFSLPIHHGDYSARHSIGDKIISSCLAAALALITTFFLLSPDSSLNEDNFVCDVVLGHSVRLQDLFYDGPILQSGNHDPNHPVRPLF
jgi:hypothetical protein